jgi:putative alpha-1,2-mannosidase
MNVKEKLSMSKGKVSFPHKCTYGSSGDWELRVYTQSKKGSRKEFDESCKPGPNVEDLGQLTMKKVLDRLKIYIGFALGSREEPTAELSQLLAPKFDDARLLLDDGNFIKISAETAKEYYLFKYSTS